MIDKKFIGSGTAQSRARNREGTPALFRQGDRRDQSDLYRRSGSQGRRLCVAAGAADLHLRGRARRRHAGSGDAGDGRQPRRASCMGSRSSRISHRSAPATPSPSSRRSATSTTRKTAPSNSLSRIRSSPTSAVNGSQRCARSSSFATEEAVVSQIAFANVSVGDTLPSLSVPALNRTTLALFAGASGDHMPLHIDTDAARKAGMPDVFGHGMLSMAYLARLLTNWGPQSATAQSRGAFHRHHASGQCDHLQRHGGREARARRRKARAHRDPGGQSVWRSQDCRRRIDRAGLNDEFN